MRPRERKSSLCTGLSVLGRDARRPIRRPICRPIHRPLRRPAWLTSWARSHPCLSHVGNSSLRGRQARLVQPSMVPVQLPARAHLRASSGWAPAAHRRWAGAPGCCGHLGVSQPVQPLPALRIQTKMKKDGADGQCCVARVCDALGSPRHRETTQRHGRRDLRDGQRRLPLRGAGGSPPARWHW